MEILNYEETLKGLICTGKEDSSRCPFLKHQLCQRKIMLLTGALLEWSQDLRSKRQSQNTMDTGMQGLFVAWLPLLVKGLFPLHSTWSSLNLLLLKELEEYNCFLLLWSATFLCWGKLLCLGNTPWKFLQGSFCTAVQNSASTEMSKSGA